MTEKEKAKKNLIWLVDECVRKGGIFQNTTQAATVFNSIEVLGADHTPAEKPGMLSVKGGEFQKSLSEFKNNKTVDNGTEKENQQAEN